MSKHIGWIAAVVTGLFVGLAPLEADAKRLGGGRSQGIQRSTPPSTPTNTPASPNNGPTSTAPTNAAAPTAGAATAGAAAAAPKRSWMGPIAGLAAGLGIAALMSHLGMGEAFGNFLMMALLAVAAIFLVRFLMRRFAGNRPAAGAQGGLSYAGAGAGSGASSTPANSPWAQRADAPMQRSSQPEAAAFGAPAAAAAGGFAAASAVPVASALPADFDAAGFERIAKMIFIRMQAANDAADLNDLRNFTTPEMFAEIRLDLQDRGPSGQQTDVVKVDAKVLDVAEETERQVVSVRFSGLIREETGGAATDFDEIWHLVKPHGGSAWAIAGIQQAA